MAVDEPWCDRSGFQRGHIRSEAAMPALRDVLASTPEVVCEGMICACLRAAWLCCAISMHVLTPEARMTEGRNCLGNQEFE